MISCASDRMVLLFRKKKAKTRPFCSDFLRTVPGLLRHFISCGEGPFIRLLRTAPFLLKPARIGIKPKGRNFIPADKSPTCSEKNPKLFSSHRCSGYFSTPNVPSTDRRLWEFKSLEGLHPSPRAANQTAP